MLDALLEEEPDEENFDDFLIQNKAKNSDIDAWLDDNKEEEIIGEIDKLTLDNQHEIMKTFGEIKALISNSKDDDDEFMSEMNCFFDHLELDVGGPTLTKPDTSKVYTRK